jgi:hypothetical protein
VPFEGLKYNLIHNCNGEKEERDEDIQEIKRRGRRWMKIEVAEEMILC